MNTPEWYNQLHNTGIVGSSGMNQTENGYERIPVDIGAELQKKARINKAGFTSKSGYGSKESGNPPAPMYARISDFRRWKPM